MTNTFGKEWLENVIQGMEECRDEIPFGLDEDGNNTLQALKIALNCLNGPHMVAPAGGSLLFPPEVLALKQLVSGASQGSWHQEFEHDCPWNIVDENGVQIAITQQRTPVRDNPKQTYRTANAAFMAAASPATVTALFELTEALYQERESWRVSYENERSRADKLAAQINRTDDLQKQPLDESLSNMLWYAEESVCHPDPNYRCEFERLATPDVVAGLIREVQQYRKAAIDNKPVAYTSNTELTFKDGFGEIWCSPLLYGADIALYLCASPSPGRDKIRQEHAEWSQVTFGNVGPIGPLKHLRREVKEVIAKPHDLSEWADMQFLMWDAQRRAGFSDEQITRAMVEKLAVNKSREWPEPKDGEARLHIQSLPPAKTSS